MVFFYKYSFLPATLLFKKIFIQLTFQLLSLWVFFCILKKKINTDLKKKKQNTYLHGFDSAYFEKEKDTSSSAFKLHCMKVIKMFFEIKC